jgi:hypothetical protein
MACNQSLEKLNGILEEYRASQWVAIRFIFELFVSVAVLYSMINLLSSFLAILKNYQDDSARTSSKRPPNDQPPPDSSRQKASNQSSATLARKIKCPVRKSSWCFEKSAEIKIGVPFLWRRCWIFCLRGVLRELLCGVVELDRL